MIIDIGALHDGRTEACILMIASHGCNMNFGEVSVLDDLSCWCEHPR